MDPPPAMLSYLVFLLCTLQLNTFVCARTLHTDVHMHIRYAT